MVSPTVGIILAAGHGTRMRSDLLKVMHEVAGVPIVRHVFNAVHGAGVDRIITVIGHQGDRVQAELADQSKYVEQREILGTGHAVMQAESLLRGFRGDVLVVLGDGALLTAGVLSDFVASHKSGGAPATLLTADVQDPTGLGRVIASEDGYIDEIVEERDATEEQRGIRHIFSGIMCIDKELLFRGLKGLAPDNAQGEYYLTEVPGILVGGGHRVAAYRAEDPTAVLAVNDRVELARAEGVVRDRIREDLMLAGVTIVDPASTFIDAGVVIEADTTIMPFSVVRGSTRIEANCTIGPQAHIVDSRIEKGCRVQYSVVEESHLGPEVLVGPYSHLRPNTRVGAAAKIGNYAEIKNSHIGPGTKVSHHSYLGDADIGPGVNIGAGTVVVNYDGQEKHRTVIDKGAFIGCNTNLVAPVKIGARAYTAAGSTITDEVPDNALAIARARQTNKEGWALRKPDDKDD